MSIGTEFCIQVTLDYDNVLHVRRLDDVFYIFEEFFYGTLSGFGARHIDGSFAAILIEIFVLIYVIILQLS